MSKERLEEIKKNNFIYQKELGINVLEDISWLIEQAERVQELEDEYQAILDETTSKRIELIEQRNKRYRNGLENALYFVKHSTNEPDKSLIMQEYLEKLLESDSDEGT